MSELFMEDDASYSYRYGVGDDGLGFDADISNWDTSSVTSMRAMFQVRSSPWPAPNLQSSPLPCALLAPRSPAALPPPSPHPRPAPYALLSTLGSPRRRSTSR
eukprot:scaffold605_cov43-Phaeocystis_antarctica.AAC.2